MRFAALAFVSVATTIILLVPAVTGTDGFPISSHPMYATARSADATFITAHATTASDTVVELSMWELADTDDPLVAETRMLRAAEVDDGLAECDRIARRVASTGSAANLTTIRIVRVSGSVTDFVRTDGVAATVEVLSSCPLP